MAMTAVPVELSELPLRQQRARLNGEDPLDHEPDGPACAVCGSELPADRLRQGAKTCGESCQREHRLRRRRAQRDGVTIPAANSLPPPGATNGAAMTHGPSERLDAPEGQPDASGGIIAGRRDGPSPITEPLRVSDGRIEAPPAPPLVDIGAAVSHPDGRDRLSPLFGALAAAGAQLVRVEVSIAEETWRITRITNGGSL
jgi:hypothetical protein